MKNYLYVLLSIIYLLIVIGCNTSPPNHFVIYGTAIGEDVNGKKLYINYFYNDSLHQDSVVIQNKKFIFQGTLGSPVRAFISDNINNPVLVYIEPSKMFLNIPYYDINNLTLSGSKVQEEYIDYRNFFEYNELLMDSLVKKVRILYVDEHQNNNSEINAIEHQIDSLRTDTDYKKFIFIKDNPSLFVSLDNFSYSFSTFTSNDSIRSELVSVFNSMPESLRKCDVGIRCNNIIKGWQESRVGDLAPDFTLYDIDGNLFSLHNVKDNFILLDFWASWCGPCRADIPFLKELYSRYKDKGLKIIAVSADNKPSLWKKAVEKDGSNIFTQLLEPKARTKYSSSVTIDYFILSYPTKIVIGKDGRIIARLDESGYEAKIKLEEILKTLFNPQN